MLHLALINEIKAVIEEVTRLIYHIHQIDDHVLSRIHKQRIISFITDRKSKIMNIANLSDSEAENWENEGGAVEVTKAVITRSWREQKVMLKRRFSILSDSDFEFEEGQKEGMLDKLSVKLKKNRAELALLFAELQTY